MLGIPKRVHALHHVFALNATDHIYVYVPICNTLADDAWLCQPGESSGKLREGRARV